MERESNPMQALCRSGCGFYGNPATDGLCSLCFKEALKKKQQPPVSAPSPSAVSNVPARSSFMETATAQPTVPCLPAPIAPASEHQPAESHIPAENIKDCGTSSSTSVGNRHAEGAEVAECSEEHSDEQDKTNDNKNVASSQPNIKAGSSKKVSEDSANAGSSVEQPDNDNSDKDDKDAKKKKNRCAVCRKKVGLTGFECRCGGLFCAVHRYSDKHDCSFNYREMGAQEIRRNNPVVVGEKIQKI